MAKRNGVTRNAVSSNGLPVGTHFHKMDVGGG